jgi:hypothetical protein
MKEMSEIVPVTKEELAQINGIGESKVIQLFVT